MIRVLYQLNMSIKEHYRLILHLRFCVFVTRSGIMSSMTLGGDKKFEKNDPDDNIIVFGD